MDYYDYDFIEVNNGDSYLCGVTKYSPNNEVSYVTELDSASVYNYDPTYEVSLSNYEIGEFKTIRAKEYTLEERIETTFKRWADQEEKIRKLSNIYDLEAKVAKMNEDIASGLIDISNIVNDALNSEKGLDWESLKNNKDYHLSRPEEPNYEIKYPYPSPPEKEQYEEMPPEPNQNSYHYIPKFTFIEKIVKSKKQEKIAQYEESFKNDYNKWEKESERIRDLNTKKDEEYETRIAEYNEGIRNVDFVRKEAGEKFIKKVEKWENDRAKYYANQKKVNESVELLKESYLNGEDEAILKYNKALLEQSAYPDMYEKIFHMEYISKEEIILIDYLLPHYESLPNIKEYKFIKVRTEITEKSRSNVEMNNIYENICYQLALRTIYEIFVGDKTEAVRKVVFNGISKELNKSIGILQERHILSVEAEKDSFQLINLANIDFKSCFKTALNGRSGAKLNNFTEIEPFALSSRTKQFVRQEKKENKKEIKKEN